MLNDITGNTESVIVTLQEKRGGTEITFHFLPFFYICLIIQRVNVSDIWGSTVIIVHCVIFLVQQRPQTKILLTFSRHLLLPSSGSGDNTFFHV
jgi:hypothetical protein